MQRWSSVHLKALYKEGQEHTPYLTQGETTTQIYPQLSSWFPSHHTTRYTSY